MAGNVVTLSDSNFEAEVLCSPLPVLVDFWAPWCGPCRAIGPTIEAIADEYLGRLKVGKLNTDDHAATGLKYNIRSIPTLMLFKQGEIVNQALGVLSKEKIVDSFQAHLG